jgi:predicted RNA-binding Zn-ribbon protein involved in translation (DUF1610 family)
MKTIRNSRYLHAEQTCERVDIREEKDKHGNVRQLWRCPFCGHTRWWRTTQTRRSDVVYPPLCVGAHMYSGLLSAVRTAVEAAEASQSYHAAQFNRWHSTKLLAALLTDPTIELTDRERTALQARLALRQSDT